MIDERSVSTLRRAGVSVSDDHVVCSQLDALRLLPRWREVRDGQRRLWWSNYDEDLRRQFRGACDASGVAFAAADKVLAFRPKPKSGPAKARKLRKAKLIREKKKDARE